MLLYYGLSGHKISNYLHESSIMKYELDLNTYSLVNLNEFTVQEFWDKSASVKSNISIKEECHAMWISTNKQKNKHFALDLHNLQFTIEILPVSNAVIMVSFSKPYIYILQWKVSKRITKDPKLHRIIYI